MSKRVILLYLDYRTDASEQPGVRSEWVTKIDEMIDKKIRETDDRWEEKLKQYTVRSHDRLFQSTSTRML